MRSRLVAYALVWGCFGTGVLLACGGDDSSSSGGQPDASSSSSGSSGNTDGSTGPVNIVASNVTVYTGTIAALDASGSQAQTFAWTVKSVPNGSAVTTATLAATASTARPAFRADVSGDYVLELTASDGSGGTAKKDVTVKAVPAPLFYMQSNFQENPAYFEYRAVGTDGTGSHPVACRLNGSVRTDAGDGGDDDSAGLALMAGLLADMGEDWWESPNPTEPSRVAFVNFDRVDAASGDDLKATLGLGTNLSTCQNPPVKVAAVDQDGGGQAEGPGIIQPRFNKAGTRVAFIENRSDRNYIVAVSYDGKDRRELAQLCEGPEDGCSQPSLFPARPQWLTDSTVGWVRNRNEDAGTADGGITWEVMVASDSANPNPQLHMTCDGLAPRSIAFLKDGSILANRQAPDAGAREDLWLLKPNATTKQCEVVRNLTNLPLDWSYARDFAISPDESEVAFIRFIQDGGTLPEGGGIRSGGDIYVAPISGATPPVPASSAKVGALFGPRYVANAQMLAFNGGIPNDAGVGQIEDASGGRISGIPVIAVIKRENGAMNFAATSDIEAGTYVMGGGNGGGCDFRLDTCNPECQNSRVARFGGGGPTMLLTLAGIGWLVGRRRTRRK